MKRISETLATSGRNSLKDANAVKQTTPNSEPRSAQVEPCPICGGMQWVSHDVPVGHPDFGKLFPCSCQQRDLDRARSTAMRASRDLTLLVGMTFETFTPAGH